MYNIPIDGEKLREALKKRHLNASYIASLIGKTPNYFSSARLHGSVSEEAIKLLNEAFKISPSEYSEYTPIPNDPLPIKRNRRNRNQDIDGEALREQLKAVGLFNVALLSERMGRGRATFSNWLWTNKMPIEAIEWLEKHYHIAPETYVIVIKDKEKEPTPSTKQLAMDIPEPTPTAKITVEGLRELIIEAVYEGVKRALNE